ncbi:MAG TPA: hypothetical protein VJK02_25935 [Anaerolineales bacterium]|nr:hypothetical protein [Anaerolineales bacterium]
MASYIVPSTEEALGYAVQSIREKDYRKGQAALTWVLDREPKNVVAWLWMAQCVRSEEARSECMRRVAAMSPFAG